MDFSLHFMGVGNARAVALGSSAAVLEAGGAPLLLIDCGPATLDAFTAAYGGLPPAVFVTHAHLDHIGGLEGLYYQLATTAGAPLVKLYVPTPLVAVLQSRLAVYPNLLAEGGSNFWDVFHLVPVSERFWHRGLSFTAFPVRHHEHLGAFGLALEGVFLYSGDTRPIPEVLNRYAARGEWIFHDCGLHGNPSHTGLDDLKREYKPEQLARMVLYHYESSEVGTELAASGLRVAEPGVRFALNDKPDLKPARLLPEPRQRQDGSTAPNVGR
ncbi:MBL fold metallo-hydrolase [Thiohalocapsa sp. ML1]|jgi:ribonuclease BN (tRNA processing enzyme)|uniref:MBL fold metallo-hydrolase n=1 Tax=Thiohalocapsa sp. ML1 TaxID=1431688 RepID=UPI0009EBAB8D|nr:MBL fold metallo-hydrolase [Thiohalocapsa sp. ML1]